MNARTLPQIQAQTSIASEALADIQAMGPWPMPVASFNDDDLYLYNAATKQLIGSLSCADQEVIDARHIGFRVEAGQTWAKGMTAKALGLWRAT